MKDFSHSVGTLLKLERTPISISFLSNPPNGVSRVKEPARACKFWGVAEIDALYATVKDHLPCKLGAQVMGFKLPAKTKPKVSMALTFGMWGPSEFYQRRIESAHRIRERSSGVISYAPLDCAPVEPNVILFICKPVQTMLLTEALARKTGERISVFSNVPGCSIVAFTYNTGKAAIHAIADYGVRYSTPLRPDEHLFTIAGNELAKTVSSLEELMEIIPRWERATNVKVPR